MLALFFNILLSGVAIVAIGAAVGNLAVRVLPRGLLCFWCWPGTAIHELSHAAACFPAMAEVKSVTLFRADGSGEVVHGEPRVKVLGMILISLAPLAGGLAALWLFNWLLGFPLAYQSASEGSEAQSWYFLIDAIMHGVGDLWAMLDFAKLTSWQFWLMLLLGMSISMRMVPSAQDFKNSAASIAIFMLAIALGFLLIAYIGVPEMGVPSFFGWILGHLHVVFAFFMLDALVLFVIGGVALFIGD